MTNSMWVTLVHFFARQSSSYDQQDVSALAYVFARQLNHASSYDQQDVSDTGLFLC